jgi:hypothetical protein
MATAWLTLPNFGRLLAASCCPVRSCAVCCALAVRCAPALLACARLCHPLRAAASLPASSWPHRERAHSESVVSACGSRGSESCTHLKVLASFGPAGGDDGLGVSLSLQPTFKAKRPEGRSKNFTGLHTGWNNKYFQTLDVNGSGAVCACECAALVFCVCASCGPE